MKTKKLQRALSILIALAMCLTLLPNVAFAEESYNLWVGGVQVTSANASDVLGDGTVSYDAATSTLILNGANIVSELPSDAHEGVYATDIPGFRIVVTGNSTISCPLGTDGATSINGFKAICIKNCSDSVITLLADLDITALGFFNGGSGFYAINSDLQ